MKVVQSHEVPELPENEALADIAKQILALPDDLDVSYLRDWIVEYHAVLFGDEPNIFALALKGDEHG
jgi:hypothetical protein